NRRELHAIDRNRNPFFEADDHLLLTVRRFLRRTRQLPGAGERRVASVFQFPALVADVPEGAIAAVNLLPAGGDRNPPPFGIVETIFSRLQGPLPPRGDHFQLRGQSLIGKFEADLIISLAGATVRDSGGALAQSH